jgi:hypothetical protein
LVRVRVDQPADQHFAHGPRIGGASSQTRRCPRTGRKRCQRASTIASATSADPSVCSVQAPLTDRSVNACQPPIALGGGNGGLLVRVGPRGRCCPALRRKGQLSSGHRGRSPSWGQHATGSNCHPLAPTRPAWRSDPLARPRLAPRAELSGDDGERRQTVAPLSAECVHKQRRALAQ